MRLLPIASRRAIAKKIESYPRVDAVFVTEGSAVVVQVKSVRLELDEDFKRLERAENMIFSDPETMRGTPVFRGTRIPVQLVADMLSQGATHEEILEGYPALDREKIELAPFYPRQNRANRIRRVTRARKRNRGDDLDLPQKAEGQVQFRQK